MLDLLLISIALGLIVSLVFSETLGKAAGGLVVPGYLALHLTRPLDIALTLLAAVVTYAVVYFGATYFIVYGKRRTAAMILVGFLLGAAIRLVASATAPAPANLGYTEYTVIGFIIPGLIAIWFDRQGVLDTCSTLLTASAMVRLLLVLVAGTQLEIFELRHAPEPPSAVQPAELYAGENRPAPQSPISNGTNDAS